MPDARVVPADTRTPRHRPPGQWHAAAQAVRGLPGVRRRRALCEVQALAVRTPEMLPVVLRGIDPQRRAAVTQLVGAITQGKLSDLAARLRQRHRRRGHCRASSGSRAGDSHDAAHPDRQRRRRARAAAAEFKVAGVFEVGCRTRTPRWCSPTSTTCARSGPSAPAATGPAGPLPRRPGGAHVRRRPAPASAAGLRGHRLDAGQRQLFPRDPHREDDDVAHPDADRGGGRIQHRRDAGHGGHRQAHRHRHPAHLRRLAPRG